MIDTNTFLVGSACFVGSCYLALTLTLKVKMYGLALKSDQRAQAMQAVSIANYKLHTEEQKEELTAVREDFNKLKEELQHFNFSG